MKQITTNNRTLLFVEVPEDIIVRTVSISTGAYLRYRTEKCTSTWSHIKIPQASYHFHGLTDTITEQQASELVGSPITDFAYEYKSSIEQLQELLQHHSITGRHAIIEVL